MALAAVGGVAAFAAAVAAANARWYAGLLKPTFAPGPWLAAAAGLVIAAATARALFRVLRRPDYLPDRPGALRLVAAALGLALLWSWLFFAGRHPSVALAVAGLLGFAAGWAALRCAVVDRRAGLLLLPFALSSLFVFLLDLSIALRNG